MTFISYEQLLRRSMERPDGYIEDVISRGTAVDGGIELEDEQMQILLRKYRPGLGDMVERVAKPIARALDKVLGTKLGDCDGCRRRRDKLNRLTRRVN